MPHVRVVTLLLSVMLVATACKRGEPVPEGDVAASLTMQSLGAEKFDPASLKGKPSLVMFVTPTCSHCLKTIPHGIAAAKAEGANVVAVFVAGGKQNAEGIVSSTKLPVALIDDGSLLRKYKIKAVPYSLVLGADGRAKDAFRGEQEESTFRDALADAK